MTPRFGPTGSQHRHRNRLGRDLNFHTRPGIVPQRLPLHLLGPQRKRRCRHDHARHLVAWHIKACQRVKGRDLHIRLRHGRPDLDQAKMRNPLPPDLVKRELFAIDLVKQAACRVQKQVEPSILVAPLGQQRLGLDVVRQQGNASIPERVTQDLELAKAKHTQARRR